MVTRLAHLLLRLVGWIMTPLVVLAAAALGATIGALPAPRLSVRSGVVVMAVAGLIGATVGFWGWLQLLSRMRTLREVLHVTTEGVPTDVLEGDPPAADDTQQAGVHE